MSMYGTPCGDGATHASRSSAGSGDPGGRPLPRVNPRAQPPLFVSNVSDSLLSKEGQP